MKKFLPLLFLLGGCGITDHSNTIISMQTVDRNGFCETISNKDRLQVYQAVDFLSAQPYEKVLRVYGKDTEGKSHSKITSYHSNGSNWQYLEAIDGRANGRYLEWHENGKIKIEATVIEGVADLTENAQKSWLFDRECSVWDEEGNLEAEFLYVRGKLEGEAKYYYSNGALQQSITYTHGIIDGDLCRFDQEGNTIEKIHYHQGVKEGPATALWCLNQSKYQEQYREGLLFNAVYFDPDGTIVSEIENGQGLKTEFEDDSIYATVEYENGIADGLVKLYHKKGALLRSYHVHEGMKNGEEWEYYPSDIENPKPHLMISWFEDKIQGITKTWYENGALESEREMSGNKKHGLSFAYYKSGELMLMEEYENDRLIQGSYYKKGEKAPVSIVQNGEGTATLYSPEAQLLKKITYERHQPVVD